MNIIIFACVDFPEGDATSSRVKLLGRTMVEGGNQVSLGILNPNAKSPIKENSKAEGVVEGIKFCYLNGTTVRPSDLLAAIKDTAKGFWRSVPFLLNLIRQKKADLIVLYTPDIFLILPCFLLAKLFRIPVVLELCEINSCNKVTGLKGHIRLIGAKATDRLLPLLCDGVIAISSNIINFVARQGASKHRILHIPVLVEYPKISRPSKTAIDYLQEKRFFMHSGTLMEKDGVVYLVKAFNAIADRYPDVLLVFTGKHPEAKKQEISANADATVRDRIIFTGFLSSDQLIWGYQNAVGLLCCRSNSQYANYGFPTKLAEYLASGRPVITNEVGDVSMYLKDQENAYITRAEDPDSIADAMKRVLDDPDRAARIGINGQTVARENFYYKKYVTKIGAFAGAVRLKLEGVQES